MTTGSGERGDKLARLIQSRRDEGASLRDIERRAKDAGYKISHTHIDSLSKNMVVGAPDTDTRRALAAGLGVSVERITALVVEDWMGYPQPGSVDDPQDVADVCDLVRAKFAPLEEGGEAWVALRRSLTRFLVEWQH